MTTVVIYVVLYELDWTAMEKVREKQRIIYDTTKRSACNRNACVACARPLFYFNTEKTFWMWAVFRNNVEWKCGINIFSKYIVMGLTRLRVATRQSRSNPFYAAVETSKQKFIFISLRGPIREITIKCGRNNRRRILTVTATAVIVPVTHGVHAIIGYVSA